MGFLFFLLIVLIIWGTAAAIKSFQPSSAEKQAASRKLFLDDYNSKQAKTKMALDERASDFTANFQHCFQSATTNKSCKYIVIDFETSDLPFDYKIPSDPATGAFPYALSVAALVFNDVGELIDDYGSLIKVPESLVINRAAFKVNNISVEDCNTNGEDITNFFGFLLKYIRMDTFLVAHNIQFENYFLKLEAKRAKIKLPKYLKFCTMSETKSDVHIYKSYGSGLKNPNLKELVAYAFFDNKNITLDNIHTAMVDAKLCALCFFKLKLNERCK